MDVSGANVTGPLLALCRQVSSPTPTSHTTDGGAPQKVGDTSTYSAFNDLVLVFYAMIY